VVGIIGTLFILVTCLLTIVAWSRGIFTPLWRLGIGLSRREITIVGSSDNCNSLLNLIKQSSLFSKKNISFITSKTDAKDLSKSNLILFQLNNSPVSLEEVLENINTDSALVIYAKKNEITDDQWSFLDNHRNVSVTNLRGRLMTDLLNTLMTSGYEKR
jgi:hypothetical protein